MADLEELIERSARSICIAAGYEPEQWADNEDLRNRCLKYAKVAVEAYESAKQKGEAEGWRSIESAPKDVRIFAWGPGWHWSQGETAFLHSDYNGNAGIICRGGQCGTPFRLGSKDAPTFWAPLPDPSSAMLSAAGER